MLKKALLALVALVAIFLGFVATRPSEASYVRSAVIHAPADVTFAFVNDFRKWPAWSPWEKLDPGMKKTLTGADAGKGAVYEWESKNDDVGHGRMTIEESAAPSKIGIKLEFIAPFQATNPTVFAFAPEGEGTKVTWTMSAKNGFMMKAVGVFMNMEKMIGKDFEAGLANLDTVATAEAKRVAEEAAAKAKAEAEAAAAAAAAALQAAEAQAALDLKTKKKK